MEPLALNDFPGLLLAATGNEAPSASLRVLSLEDGLTVVAEELAMRPQDLVARHTKLAVWIEHPGSLVGERTPRSQNGEIVIDREQPAVEHPVHCRAQGNSVPD